jgi:hypothetical protein
MAKSCHSDVIDGALDIIRNNANLMILCSAQPTTRAEAVTTYALADVAMAAGDYTKAADGAGRKLTVAAKTGVTVDVSGTGSHIAWVDGSRLLYVTTCPNVLVNNPGTVDFAAVDIGKIGQPT